MSQKPNAMIARLLTTFLDLDVRWEFVAGAENTFADLLSRHVFTSDDGGPLPPAPDDPPTPRVKMWDENLIRQRTIKDTEYGPEVKALNIDRGEHPRDVPQAEDPKGAPTNNLASEQGNTGETDSALDDIHHVNIVGHELVKDKSEVARIKAGEAEDVETSEAYAELRALTMAPGDIKEWQKFDTWASPHVTFKTTGTLPDKEAARRDVLLLADTMVIDENSGILYRISKSREKSQQANYQLCVPAIMRPEILHLFHDHPVFGGHMSIRKAFYRLSQNFYWPGFHDAL
jgi:hypothetical protein